VLGVARFLLFALALTLAACGAEDSIAPAVTAEAPPPTRLLTAPIPATLGAQTRLANGTQGVVLFSGSYEAGANLPRLVRLPAELAVEPRVLLNYRYWGRGVQDRLPGVRVAQSSVAATIDRTGPTPRAPLDFPGAPRDSAFQAQLVGFPLAEEPTHIDRFDLALPASAVLELGYGLREESWTPGAESTRFVARLISADESRVLVDRTLDPANPEHRQWYDARFELPETAGRVELVLETTRADTRDRHSLPAWSDPVVYFDGARMERPSVVVISLDTLRSRSLDLYGYGRDTAPNLSSIAARGVTFDEAITTSVTTAPSHMSLFTGLYPVRHGIRRGNEHKRPGIATLSLAFREAGYATAAFTENGYLLRPRGFGEGFGEYTENRGDDRKGLGDARATFGQVRTWLERQRRRPYFLFVHTYQVHSPYAPEGAYATLFEGDDLPGPETAAIRAERDRYDREIRVADDELEKLIATIERTSRDGSVLVVVLSDHGEEFKEHGALQHGGSLFEESLRIPLVFFWPGHIPAGRRIEAPVSLIDVAPTILDLAGLDALPQATDGRSLAKIILGEAPAGDLAKRTLFAEAFSPRRWVDIWKFETWNPPLLAVRGNGSKFIVHRPTTGEQQPTVRYDLADDPEERSPQPVTGAELSRVDALVDGYLGGASGASDGTGADPDGAGEPLSPDVRARLQALGYAE
jgi:arylsulfatase A-like enzyme